MKRIPSFCMIACSFCLPGLCLPARALTFAQVALGGGYETTIILSNKKSVSWQGEINIYQGNYDSWSGTWKHNGTEVIDADGFPVTLDPKGTTKLVLTGDSEVRSGYLEIDGLGASSDGDVAVSYFYNFLQSGKLAGTTGSPASESARKFLFAVEKTAAVNTGFAWAPSLVTTPFQINLTLFTTKGEKLQQKSQTFKGHVAMFFDQLFDAIPASFVGSVLVEADQEIYFTVLRLEVTGTGFLLTSVPPDSSFP